MVKEGKMEEKENEKEWEWEAMLEWNKESVILVWKSEVSNFMAGYLAACRKRKEEREKLISVYDEYVALLVDELNDLVGLACVQGWKSKRVEEGIRLREEIAKLKEAK